MTNICRLLTCIKTQLSILVCTIALISTTSVLADDWIAQKLRGGVYALQEGQWHSLKRGDVVSDQRTIRTRSRGRVTFTRGNEVIDVGGDTQIRIYDKTSRKFTTVMQDFGTVSIEANVEDVEHFAIATPFMSAVVKGTKFTVEVSESTAKIDVDRGRVQVSDTRHNTRTNVSKGQSAVVETTKHMTITGLGVIEPIVALNGTIIAPSSSSTSPGNSGNAPGQSGDTSPGKSGEAPGQSGSSSPGNSGNAPGQNGGSSPGNSGNAPGKNK